MSNKKASENGKATRFSTTNQPQKSGRKPSIYNQIKDLIKVEINIELSREDFVKMAKLLLVQPIRILQSITKDEDTPSYVVLIARAILKDASEGRITTLDSLLDRIFGKATQPTQQDVSIAVKGSVPIKKWIEEENKK